MVVTMIMKIIFLVSDSYVKLLIIIKLKNVVPIKDINSILKINKKSVFTSLFRRM